MLSDGLPPWASGPGEILRHGLDLLQNDSDTNRRLAMIALDNAVELTIKTYLGLPERITGLHIPHKEFQEFSKTFPTLLDALDRYARTKIVEIDLAEIEWYHRLRNTLYHDGNGLTVERDKVDSYAKLAGLLFKCIFGLELFPTPPNRRKLLGDFFEVWIDLEKALLTMVQNRSQATAMRMGLLPAARFLRQTNSISEEDLKNIEYLQQLRNAVIHGAVDYRHALTPETVKQAKGFHDRFFLERRDRV